MTRADRRTHLLTASIRKHVCILLIFFAGSLLTPLALCAQDAVEYEPVSLEELRVILEDVRAWTAETIELLKNAKDLPPQKILAGLDAIRKKFDPVMVLIATTEPAAEYKKAAVTLLMGTKGVELALWHYIYSILDDSQPAKDHGDVLMSTAIGQLNAARALFSQLP